MEPLKSFLMVLGGMVASMLVGMVVTWFWLKFLDWCRACRYEYRKRRREAFLAAQLEALGPYAGKVIPMRRRAA